MSQRARVTGQAAQQMSARATALMLAALSAGLAAVAGGADAGPTVAVSGGRVRGSMLASGGAVFKGIPYAQPPVGDLRWRQPMPVKPWTGVRDSTVFGERCAQVPRNPGDTSSEDCLFLNIWTPEWPPKSRKAVMVWIVGGGNFSSGASGRVYDGENLARRGVVMVSFNYRLGSFGFFSHPELTRESPHHASGNQGLLDQIAVLKWVRDNIAKFGGDANNVTVFGSSAGSLDISVLMTTPLSRGLFRRAIGQSGHVSLAGDPLTLSEAEKRGEALAVGWKLPPRPSAKDLRAIPAAEIWKAQPDYFRSPFPNLGITIDGYVVPRKPAEVFAAGQGHRVSLMLGSNSREQGATSTPLAGLSKVIEDVYGPLAAGTHAMYDGSTDPIYGSPADQWDTDTSYRCGTVAQLMWHAAAGNLAFQYEFARTPVGREAVGSTHATELSYVFGTFQHGVWGMGPPARATAVDFRISDVMQQYWTNFAKTGNPNSHSLPTWPKFDVTTRAYIQFTDAGPVAKEGLRRPFCDVFMQNLQNSKRKPESK